MDSFFSQSWSWALATTLSAVSGPALERVVVLGLLLLFVGLAAVPSAYGGEGGDRALKVRAPVFAGSWYEGNPAALADSIEGYLEGHDRPSVNVPPGRAEASRWIEAGRYPAAVIVPHAGHVFSGECAGSAFRLLEKCAYSRVLLLGPSHRVGFRGVALPEEDAFATPLGVIPLDRAAIKELAGIEGFQILPRAHAQEHSLEIELPFLQQVLPAGFTLVPMVVGSLSDSLVPGLARGIARLWDATTLVVVSSDFTHFGDNYGYVPFRENIPDNLKKLDQGAIDRILKDDPSGFEKYCVEKEATICGAAPIRILLTAAQGRNLEPRLVEYYRSGDMVGDFRNSVSYAAIAFFPPAAGGARTDQPASEEAKPAGPRPLNDDEQAFLLELARHTITALVGHSPVPEEETPARFPAGSPLRELRGVFVTLTTIPGNQLRGCIGNIEGDLPLTSGVVQNAIAAASRDPRFIPVGRDELEHLHLEISVLTPLEEVSGPEAIVIGRDGVVMEKHGRRAVFLPQVAPEQGWDVPEMLRNLSLKAGLGPNDWKSGATFSTFQAQVFEEKTPGGKSGSGK